MMRFVGSFFGSDRLMTVSMPSVGPTMYERHGSFSNLTVFFYFYFWFQIWMLPPLERSLEGESNCKLRVASRKKIQVVMHATSSIIRSSCFSSLVCQCYKQNKQNKERERMREREREGRVQCRLQASGEWGRSSNQQGGTGRWRLNHKAMDCKIMHLPHTQLSLYLPLYLYQGCCSLLPAASSQSVRQTVQSLSPLSLYLSKLSPADLHMIRIRACSVSLSRHACMFLSFFQFSLPSLSLSSLISNLSDKEKS